MVNSSCMEGSLDYVATMNHDNIYNFKTGVFQPARTPKPYESPDQEAGFAGGASICQRIQRMVLDVHDCSYQHCLCVVYPMRSTNVLWLKEHISCYGLFEERVTVFSRRPVGLCYDSKGQLLSCSGSGRRRISIRCAMARTSF